MLPLLLWFGLLAAAHADAPHTLTVATWNTHGLPAPLTPGRRWRLPTIHRTLHGLDADVVALQEVWGGARALVAGPRVVSPSASGDTGLAVYTPHPRTDVRVLHFDRARGWDRLKRKGALHATVTTPRGPVHVVTVHLQAGDGTKCADVRAAQVDELLGWLSGLDGPTVLLGDVNFTEAQPGDRTALARLADAGFVDAADRTGEGPPTWQDRRLDRIYVRGSLEPVHVRTRPDLDELSDHRLLLVDLTVTPRPAGG